MKEILVLMAQFMSKDEIVDRVQTSIDEYKESVLLSADKEEIDEKLRNIIVNGHILSLKMIIEDKGPNGVKEIMTEMQEFDRTKDFFKTNSN